MTDIHQRIVKLCSELVERFWELKRRVRMVLSGIAGRIHPVGTKAKKFRRRIIGTLSIAVFIILVYQFEVLIATQLGYYSPHALFGAAPTSVKPFITLLFGPFLHQTASHAFGNIGVLLLTGAYVEYFHGERRLYVFYGVVGYIAAVPPLFSGTVGAIGASGVTYGLSSWMAVQAIERIWAFFTDIVGEEDILYRRFGHLAAFLFGAGNTFGITSLVLRGKIDGAGDATHFLGAMIGLVVGTLLIVYNHDQIAPKTVDR